MIVQFHLNGYSTAKDGEIIKWETKKTTDLKGNDCEEWIAVIEDIDSGLIYRVPKNHIIDC